MIYNKICICCGDEFKTIERNQLYCSKECKYDNYRLNLKDGKYVPHSPIELKCKLCNTPFKQKGSNHIFCSKECCLKYSEEEFKKRGRFIIFERDDFTCFYCGRKSYKDWKSLNCDHVTPKSMGGKPIASNLVTACEDCNKEKFAMLINNVTDIFEEVTKRNKNRNINPNLKIEGIRE